MADIAELGLKVDARQVGTAETALDKLADAAIALERAVTKLGDTTSTEFSKTARAAKDSSDAHVNAYRAQQAAGDRYLQGLRNEVSMMGKTRAEIEGLRSAQAGLTTEQQRSAVAMGAQLDAMKAQQGAMSGLMGGAQALGAIYATTFAVSKIYDFSKAMFDASVNGQRLKTTLDFATGGNGAKELEYVTQFADRLGLQLNTTAKAYGSMAAAARGTSLEGEGARKVFEAISKSSVVMGLSAEQTGGAINALQQMISKGTVQSEELRGQLAERLPGSFQIAARAMGVTTQELGKMLEQGLVPASEFLPKFAAQLEKELGGAAESAANRLDAAVNRFETAWERLKRAAGDAGVAKAFSATAEAAANGANTLADSIERMTASKSWGEWFNAAIWSQKNLTAEIKDAQAEVDRTSAILGKAPSNIYFKNAAADAQEYLNKLKEIAAQQAGLMPGASGPGRVDRERQTARDQGVMDQQAKERADELKTYLERNVALSKGAIIEKEIAAARESSAKMAAKWAGDFVQTGRINLALEQQIANIREKHNARKGPSGAAAANDSINAELEAFKRGQQVQEEIARRTIANIGAMRREGTITAEEAARQVAAVEVDLNAAAITALQMQIEEVKRKGNSRKEVAALEGQIAVQTQKQLTREAALEQQISDIRRERAEADERRHADADNAAQRELTSMEESNKRTREDIELIGLTEEAKQRVVDARMANVIALQRERVATLQTMSVSEQDNTQLDIEKRKLDALVESRDLYNQGNTKDRQADQTKRVQDAFDQWSTSFTGNLSSDIADSIISGGEGSAEKLRKTLQDALIRQPLTAIINGTLNAMLGGALQMMGLGGGGGGLGGAAGGSPLGSLFSLGSSLYSGYTGLTSGTGFMGSIGNAIGLGGGTSGLSALAATNVGSVGGVGSGVIGANGAYTATAGASTAGAGSLAGGGIAALIMLAVINALGGMRTETQIGAGLAGTLGGKNSLTPWQEWREGGTLFDGSSFATHNPLEELEKYRKKAIEQEEAGNLMMAGVYQGLAVELEKTTKGLSTEVEVYNREIGKGYKTYRSNVVDMANSLGLAGDKVADFAYTLGAQDLNFQGLNPQEIAAKIQTTFGLAGKDMAQQLLGSWKEVTETITTISADGNLTQSFDPTYTSTKETTKRIEYFASVYAKAGETAIQTLERLSTSFNTLNEASDALGFGIHKGSLSLANFADEFIEAFGGLERFATQTNSFLQNYYTDGERRTAGLSAAVRGAERIGLKGVTVEGLEAAGKGGIREGVNSLVTNPELYGNAMEWANGIAWLFDSVEEQVPAVQELASAVDTLTEMYKNAVKSLKGDAQNLAVEELRARGDEVGADALARQQYLDSFVNEQGVKLDETRLNEIATLYDANMATRARIAALKDEQKAMTAARDLVMRINAAAATATDKAYAEALRWIGIERDLLEETKASASAVFELVKSNVQELYRSTDAASKALGMSGEQFIKQAIAGALATGVLPDADKLSDAIGDVRNVMDKQAYGSKFESERARLILAGNLSVLEEMAGDQLSDAEQQLQVLKDMEAAGAEMLAAMRGTEGYAKSMSEALANLVTAFNTESGVRAANAGKLTGTGSAYYDTVTGKGQNDEGVAFSGSGMVSAVTKAMQDGATPQQAWDFVNQSGFTMAQANTILGLSPGTLQAEAIKAGLPIFHNGTGMVQNTGFALLERGEEVVTKGRNPAFAGTGGVANEQAMMAVALSEQNDAAREARELLKDIRDALNGQGLIRVRLGADQLSQIAGV